MRDIYHSPLFEHIKKYFELHDSEKKIIFIFAPYIKTNVLKRLVENIQSRIIIITTWTPHDIQFGSSELELYPFCKEHNVTLYISENLHLKVYSAGLDSAILATGNVSHNGLLPDGNYEAASLIERLTNEDRLFFSKIQNEARLIDDKTYHELCKWYEENRLTMVQSPQLLDIISEPQKDTFSVASLPMTRSVNDLIVGYQNISKGLEPSDDSEISACIFHDLVNYRISTGLDETQFRDELTSRFFEHPFIQRIDKFIIPEAYFGRIKEWIQNNCTDVPVPSRRELVGNVQVLLEWFENLGNGKYIIDVPGRHSQRIRKL